MTGEGIIRAICISEKRGIQKHPVPKAVFRAGWGIETDAHAGRWHRQVSLLSYERIRDFNARGACVKDGDFGENLVVEGIDFRLLPVGTVLRTGDTVLRMTQIGKDCHSHCAIYRQMGECIMPTQGVFAEVIHSGTVRPGDRMTVEPPAPDRPFTAAVITLSDSGAGGKRQDESGPLAAAILRENGFDVLETLLLPDDRDGLEKQLCRLADQRQISLVVTTGGTGFSPRDNTPEATLAVMTRNAPGIAEAIREASRQITDRAMLSRGMSVLRGHTLIVNLPGSPKAVRESMAVFVKPVRHGLKVLRGAVRNCADDFKQQAKE